MANFRVSLYHKGKRLLTSCIYDVADTTAADNVFYEMYLERYDEEQETSIAWSGKWDANDELQPLLPSEEEGFEITYQELPSREEMVRQDQIQQAVDKARREWEEEQQRIDAHHAWGAEMKERCRLKWTDYALGIVIATLFRPGV
jgi:hypothetical protein